MERARFQARKAAYSLSKQVLASLRVHHVASGVSTAWIALVQAVGAVEPAVWRKEVKERERERERNQSRSKGARIDPSGNAPSGSRLLAAELLGGAGLTFESKQGSNGW